MYAMASTHNSQHARRDAPLRVTYFLPECKICNRRWILAIVLSLISTFYISRKNLNLYSNKYYYYPNYCLSDMENMIIMGQYAYAKI